MYVNAQLDSERSVTAVISTNGGALTAEAADGSIFTLTIPPDALLSDQAITMTPLMGIEGEDRGDDFVAGVELAPDGLQLYAAASLGITPAQSIPPEMEVSFAVHGGELVLFPLLPQAGDATFSIIHFSAYYLGAGGLPMVQAALQGVPSRPEDQLLQQIQQLINNERRAAILGEEEDPLYRDLLLHYMLSYYNQVLRPHIQAAANSDDWRFICQVIGEVLGFQRTLLMEEVELDIEFDYLGILKKLIEREARLLEGYSRDLCRDGFVVQAWTVMLRVARAQQVLRTSLGVEIQEWQSICAPPNLSFTSRIVATLQWGAYERLTSDATARATVPLRYNPNQNGFQGEGVLDIEVAAAESLNGVSGDAATSFCVVSWAPVASTMTVEKLVVNLNHSECAKLEESGDPDLELEIKTGEPLENYREDCSHLDARMGRDVPERDPVPGPVRWYTGFGISVKDYLVEETHSYRFTKWEFAEGRRAVFVQLEPGCLYNPAVGTIAVPLPCPDDYVGITTTFNTSIAVQQ